MKKILLLTISAILFFSFNSCEIINPDEEIPSYIEIDTQKVEITSAEQGSNNHGIIDAWIYIDDIYQGNYEPPVVFPVLKKGKHKITMIAGIKTNGISATREEYPFYKEYEIDTVLTKNKVLKINPTYTYINNAHFWVEDFQDANIKFTTLEGMKTDTVFVHQKDANKPGNYYGAIYLTPNRPKFNTATNPETDPIRPWQADRRMFLEFQYKNNQKFWVGLYADNISHSIELLNPSVEWNTIYIDLTPTIKTYHANVYMLFFYAEYNGKYNGEIFIDNVKLINYE